VQEGVLDATAEIVDDLLPNCDLGRCRNETADERGEFERERVVRVVGGRLVIIEVRQADFGEANDALGAHGAIDESEELHSE
jgi:hypothetical protein